MFSQSKHLPFFVSFFFFCFQKKQVSGGNPCLEQSLESFEMCCLVETFPSRHDTKEEYLETLKYAFLYAKTVTLGGTHWIKTNAVMSRNRRIGCSMSGIAQFTAKHGIHELVNWCEDGYNHVCVYLFVFCFYYYITRYYMMVLRLHNFLSFLPLRRFKKLMNRYQNG